MSCRTLSWFVSRWQIDVSIAIYRKPVYFFVCIISVIRIEFVKVRKPAVFVSSVLVGRRACAAKSVTFRVGTRPRPWNLIWPITAR